MQIWTSSCRCVYHQLAGSGNRSVLVQQHDKLRYTFLFCLLSILLGPWRYIGCRRHACIPVITGHAGRRTHPHGTGTIKFANTTVCTDHGFTVHFMLSMPCLLCNRTFTSLRGLITAKGNFVSSRRGFQATSFFPFGGNISKP
jgi:hypothetical protein